MSPTLKSSIPIVLAVVSLTAVGTASAQDVYLHGLLRDFKPYNVAGGHPDMEAPDPDDPLKKYISHLIEPVLGANGRPEFGTSGWEVLDGATNDARAMRDLLIGRFDFPEENVHMLLDGDATRDAIVKSFKKWNRTRSGE